MHDLVVADRQHVVLGVGVHHRERHLVVVVLRCTGSLRHVAQRVVHPAHVPLEAEAQAAEVRRPGDARPGGRLLGDRDDARAPACRPSRSSPAGTRPPRGSPGRRDCWAPTRRPCASSRGRASRRRRRPAARRCGTPRASTARWRPGSCAPRCGRSRTRSVPQSGCSPRRGSACSYSGVPSKRASAQSSFGKCAGTQSTITPMPAWCSAVDEVAEVVGVAEARRRRVVRRSPGSPRSRRTGARPPAGTRRG